VARRWLILLQVSGLSVNYGHARALVDVSLHVNAGEVIAVVGRNGAGKTTLLRALTGLVKPRAGEVMLDGMPITSLPAHKIVGMGVSHVPQGRQVFGDQTVEDNLTLGAYMTVRKSPKRVKELIEREYERFPRLKERRSQHAGTLSGGEQQMLAMSRALMSEPKLLVLDEPSMGLSPLFVKHIFDTIMELKKAGTTILIVEQLALAALSISDRSYVLQMGSVCLEGESSTLLEDDKVLKMYLGAS
jgi:branched-chain amino acid transport system ATP-binding protein